MILKSSVTFDWDKISPLVRWQRDDSGVLMANKQSGGIPDFFTTYFGTAISEIEALTGKKAIHVMLNSLPWNCIVPIHTDTVIQNPRRWHLPLVTDPKHCFFWDEDSGFKFPEVGYWYEVDYSIRHTIGNLGMRERVHLIVDTLR